MTSKTMYCLLIYLFIFYFIFYVDKKPSVAYRNNLYNNHRCMSGAGNANNQAILRLLRFNIQHFRWMKTFLRKIFCFTVFGCFAKNICCKIFSIISFVCKIKYNKFLFLHLNYLKKWQFLYINIKLIRVWLTSSTFLIWISFYFIEKLLHHPLTK